MIIQILIIIKTSSNEFIVMSALLSSLISILSLLISSVLENSVNKQTFENEIHVSFEIELNKEYPIDLKTVKIKSGLRHRLSKEMARAIGMRTNSNMLYVHFVQTNFVGIDIDCVITTGYIIL